MDLSSDTQVIVINAGNNSGTPSKLIYNLAAAQYNASDLEVAVGNLYVYNSLYNVVASLYNNAFCQYIFPQDGGFVTVDVNFNNGFYSADALGEYIQRIMVQNNHYLTDKDGNIVYYLSINANAIYYGVSLTYTPVPTSLPAGWTAPSGFVFPVASVTPQLIVPSTNNFYQLIGYTPATIPATPQTSLYSIVSNLVPQISPSYAFLIKTNIVNDSSVNLTFPNVICQFSFATTSYQSQLFLNNPYLMWYKMLDGNYPQFTFQFIDQLNRELPLQDPNVSITLLIRPRRKLLK